ncbi:MAG TPA: hypothetical protein VFV87_19685 [Pirellulaceae bacterium]|nr:hypothetical protein [Pirellulaceae bacterium]
MKFSISQLLEITAIIGLTLALDRISTLWKASGFGHLIGIATVWGACTGAYLGFRWSKRRDIWAIMAAAGVAAAVATLINAARLGIMVAETLRTHYGYFNWTKDWPTLLGFIFFITIVATALAPLLVIFPIICESVWRTLKK